jgi:sulfur carrier protein
MRLTINGDEMEVGDTVATVHDLLQLRQLAGSPCAVEVNATLVPRRAHEQHVLKDGDRVEIVTLVGGG